LTLSRSQQWDLPVGSNGLQKLVGKPFRGIEHNDVTRDVRFTTLHDLSALQSASALSKSGLEYLVARIYVFFATFSRAPEKA
jgi:hypothetical protein